MLKIYDSHIDFNFQPKNTSKGPPDLEDDAALPLDIGMTLAHQPMDKILISLAQMVHFGSEQPLIIPDFGILKICVFRDTLISINVFDKQQSTVLLRHLFQKYYSAIK